MSEKRFFLKGVELGKNIIEGEEHNHLANVMRIKVGEEIVLIGDDDFDYFAKVVEIKKNQTIVDVFKKEINLANPIVEVTAFVAMNKREHMSLIVRMLSELGVSTIIPIITKWTLKQDQTDKIDRYQKIADQSIKQCERSKTMKIQKPLKLQDACKQFGEFEKVYFAYEKAEKSTIDCNLDSKKIAFIIGPVAGFDVDEAKMIEAAGATPITLGKRILRADTATIALASAIMNRVGEWNR